MAFALWIALPADATTYTWQGSGGNWNVAGNWNPSGPPSSAADTGIIASANATANANLGTTGNQPTIIVSNRTLSFNYATSGHTLILAGATLAPLTSVNCADAIQLQGTNNVIAGSGFNLTLSGPITNGASAGMLTLAPDASYGNVTISGGTNTYSGGTRVKQGSAAWNRGTVLANGVGCLGLGSVTLDAGATLTIGATNVTAPGQTITVAAGGCIAFAASTAGHTIILSNSASIQGTQDKVLTNNDSFQISGTCSVSPVLEYANFYINGVITDGASAGKLAITPGANQVIPKLGWTNNTYSGGTDIYSYNHWNRGVVKATSGGSLGTGTVTLISSNNANGNAELDFDASTTNHFTALAGQGTVVVTGSGTLTMAPAAGWNADIKPRSTITNGPGTLVVSGAVALSQGAGKFCGLYANIANVGGVLSNDLLSVSGNVTGLTNANLYVAVSNNVSSSDVAGKGFKILTCANNLSGAGVNFNTVTWNGSWNGTVLYGNGYVVLTNLATALPSFGIMNVAVSNVQATSAIMNGYLTNTSSVPVTVSVLWGETNGAISGSWAHTNSWPQGYWTNGDYPSTNITILTQDRNYYYTYAAASAASNSVAPSPQYFITGSLAVQATDPVGRTNSADTAAFTVYRPLSCTNEDLVVNYMLGGTATNVADYAIAPASGSVILQKGQTNGVITVTPVFKLDSEKTVVLTLWPGAYAMGSSYAATCTLAAVTSGTTYTWQGTPGANWDVAGNWTPAGGPPANSVDRGVIASANATANANLGAGGNRPTIIVSNRTLNLNYATSGHTFNLDTATLAPSYNGVNCGDALQLQGTNNVTAGYGENITINGPISNGASAGTLVLSPDVTGNVTINGSGNTYSGGTRVKQGSAAWNRGTVLANGVGCLGLGDVTLDAGATLTLGATNVTAPGRTITVAAGGGINISTNTVGHTIILNNASIQGTSTSSDSIQANGSCSVNSVTDYTQFNVNGGISNGASPGKLVINPGNYYAHVKLGGTSNTYGGGTEIHPYNSWSHGVAKAAGGGSLGSGAVTLISTTDTYGNAELDFDASTTNRFTALAGQGTVVVPGTLTLAPAAGWNADVQPRSTITNGPGTLVISGALALSQGAGKFCGLYINIANVGSALSNDLLFVSGNVTGLANANLYVTVSNNVASADLAGKSLTVLTCANNLSAPGTNFNAVVWDPRWKGSVVYGNGFVALANLRKLVPGTMVILR